MEKCSPEKMPTGDMPTGEMPTILGHFSTVGIPPLGISSVLAWWEILCGAYLPPSSAHISLETMTHDQMRFCKMLLVLHAGSD